MHEPPKKVVLAYSGGLDTSVILRWLQETYGCEVVTFTADIGQGEEAGAGACQGRGARRARHPHREPARDLRARLRLPHVPGQRHLPRASTCSAPPSRGRSSPGGRSRSRAKPAPMRLPTVPPARATTRCASSSATTRTIPASGSSRPGASGTSISREALAEYAETAPDPHPAGQARRAALLHRRQPPAHLLRGQGAGGPLGRAGREHVHPLGLTPGGTGPADHHRDRVRGRRCGSGGRRSAEPGGPAGEAERARRRQRDRAASTWWRTASSA